MNTFRRLWDLIPFGALDENQMMKRLGVEPRRTRSQRYLPPVGSFGAGFAIGMAAGVLVAPKAGKELRDELRSAIANWGQRGEPKTAKDVASRSTAADMSHPLGDEPTNVSHPAQA
jgi:hypothetical protein